MKNKKIRDIYHILLKQYGPQGWWPLIDLRDEITNDIHLKKGYHPGDYSFPQNGSQQFEICVGAILTQNTSWTQVEKALDNLKRKGLLDFNILDRIGREELMSEIKPSGYFNQKARKIKFFTDFFIKLNGRIPKREELLRIWGIGKETADSMLLYAFKLPFFVIDAYTKRIFSRIFNRVMDDYDEMQSSFQNVFKNELEPNKLIIFNEFHSLIVEHSKNVCKKSPNCYNCILKDLCDYD